MTNFSGPLLTDIELCTVEEETFAGADGDPVHGYLPSGTVAGVIDDRPSCAALIERIVAEAEATLARLAGSH